MMTIDYVAETAKIWDTPDVDCSTAAIRRALDELTAAMKAKGWPKATAELSFEGERVCFSLRLVPIWTPTAEEPKAFRDGRSAYAFASGAIVSESLTEARRLIAEELATETSIATAAWFDVAQLEEREAS